MQHNFIISYMSIVYEPCIQCLQVRQYEGAVKELARKQRGRERTAQGRDRVGKDSSSLDRLVSVSAPNYPCTHVLYSPE